MLSAQFQAYSTVLAVTQPIDFITILVAGIFNTIRYDSPLPSFHSDFIKRTLLRALL